VIRCHRVATPIRRVLDRGARLRLRASWRRPLSLGNEDGCDLGVRGVRNPVATDVPLNVCRTEPDRATTKTFDCQLAGASFLEDFPRLLLELGADLFSSQQRFGGFGGAPQGCLLRGHPSQGLIAGNSA
jgi:hypothetical protein